MKIRNAVVATAWIGLLAACATQTSQMPMAEVNVTNDLTHRFGEVQIAVNPKNPNNLVFVENKSKMTTACQVAKDPLCAQVPSKMGGGGGTRGEMKFPQGFFTGKDFDTATVFASFDRGKTWKAGKVPIPSPQYPDLHGWGDPSVAAAPDGTFYFSYDNMDWGTPERTLPKSIVGVSKSTDGGLTWTPPVAAGTAIDGPKSVVDLSTGTIYEASGFGNRQVVSSKDGMTWTKSNGMGGSDGTKTHTPGMGTSMSAAHGMIAVAFRVTDAAACAFFVGGAAPCVVFQTSTDTAATWKRHRVPVTGPAGALALAADPSKKDHFTVAVQDARATKFMVYQTTDGGGTWTGPTTLADEPTKNYYHAWATYSSDGVFGLVWRSRTPVPGQPVPGTGPQAGEGAPLPYNVWGAISRDGGATFSAPLKVNSAESPAPPAGDNGGDDYSSIVIDHGYAYFGWADWRPGDRQGFFRAITLDTFKP